MFAVMTLPGAEEHIAKEIKSIYNTAEAAAIAGLVIENITGQSLTERISHKKYLLDEKQVDQLHRFVSRLRQHEPVQYVLNEVWFYGFKFYVDRNVLIPRPETEELVDWVIKDCKFPINELSILDIGTGSGCIPVSLKRKLRRADVWSCDVSEAALEVARRNAVAIGSDVNFITLDFLNVEQRKTLPAFDIIISNPPYVPENNKEQMRDNVLKYEPALALFVPDDDPMLFYKTIAGFAGTHLHPRGAIYLEIHEDLGKAVSKLFTDNNYTTEIKKDMQGKERMVKATAG